MLFFSMNEITEEIQLFKTYKQTRARCFICGSILDERRKCIVELGHGKFVTICNRNQCEEISKKSVNIY